MTSISPPTLLSQRNAHPRDAFIEFDEGPHIYTVHGKQGYTSVTTWNHSHFAHFDADAILDRMMRKPPKPGQKYYGLSREEILASWEANRDSAASAGTQMHYDIECYYNGIPRTNTSVEYQYFLQFAKEFSELIPYRTEWMVYYEELKLSGSIDMVFENPDGTLQIYDWKRSKEIKYDSYQNRCATTECIGHLPDSNFWHYSLQLNMYKTILEHKYGKTVNGLYLVCLHPDTPYKTFDRIPVPILEKEMADLLELRRNQVNADLSNSSSV